MAKILFVSLCAALIVAIALGIWRFSLSAPWYHNADGTTMWNHQMSLVEQNSTWPYVTKYTVNWNGVSMIDGGETVASNRWIEFALWNGHGIDDIKVYELDEEEQRLVYPSKENARGLSHTSESGPISAMTISIGTTRDEDDDRYIIFGVKPPAESVENLSIVVTDIHGNVTTDVVAVASIED